MVMDRQLKGYYYDSKNGIRFNDETLSSIFSDQNLVSGFVQNDYAFIDPPPPFPPDPNTDRLVHFHEDCDFSDVVLTYISQMLMEEDIEEKNCTFHEAAALQAAEKSFYDVIGEKYPPSVNRHGFIDQFGEILDERGSDVVIGEKYPPFLNRGGVPYADQFGEILDERSSWDHGTGVIGEKYPPFVNHRGVPYVDQLGEISDERGSGDNRTVSASRNHDPNESECLNEHSVSVGLASMSTPQSSHSSTSSSSQVLEGLIDSPMSNIRISDIMSDSQSFVQFKKGAEDASKFLPIENGLSMGNVEFKKEKMYENETSTYVVRGKKKPHHSNDLDLEEGRSNKQSAVYSEETVRSQIFDMVLLCNGGQGDAALRQALQSGASKNQKQNGQSKGSSGGKGRGKKQGSKRNVIDLSTLLTLCAQAVAADDRRTASDLLKQIRQHSSPTGDGMQRMAHYFADGLEARMAGFGTKLSKGLILWPSSAASILKAYHMFLAACPFKKLSNFFANKTIVNISEKATKVHVIDFGILYGFPWPCLIQRLASRPGGPPNLRITGIDFPHPGFRPAERVEETGRRLANYAETFKVPFKFKAIAQKWETIQLEDLNIESDEVLVVNCQYRFRNLLDETVVADSPRSIVLNLIRKMNPDVYVQGIVNGTYNAPFFITRFREALFHYSSLFDMLETNVPREIPERVLVEREIFGREAINVIACEGAQRIDRPETYKQWQVRNLRAGFKQLPLDREIMNMAKDRVESFYHKDFLIDEDGHWMLLGWKGRIIYALSSWKPRH